RRTTIPRRAGPCRWRPWSGRVLMAIPLLRSVPSKEGINPVLFSGRHFPRARDGHGLAALRTLDLLAGPLRLALEPAAAPGAPERDGRRHGRGSGSRRTTAPRQPGERGREESHARESSRDPPGTRPWRRPLSESRSEG